MDSILEKYVRQDLQDYQDLFLAILQMRMAKPIAFGEVIYAELLLWDRIDNLYVWRNY